MDSRQAASSRDNIDSPTEEDGTTSDEDNNSNSVESDTNEESEGNGGGSNNTNNQNRPTDAMLNQLISTVSQANSNERAVGQNPAQVHAAAAAGHDTAQSYIQQLATLSAANRASPAAGLPVYLPATGVASAAVNGASNDANNAMHAAAYLLSTTASGLIQANAQQHQPPQQQLQSLLGNQGTVSGNNLMANLLALQNPAYFLGPNGTVDLGANPLVLGQYQGLLPAVGSLPTLVPGSVSVPSSGVAAVALSASMPKQAGSAHMTNRPAVTLDMDYDSHVLNDYQSLLRKQIELFETSAADVGGKAQGRNKPVVIGQVGIRCRHCSCIPKSARPKGSVYYSRSLVGIYQIAQNMAKVHYGEGKCRMIPETTKNRLLELQTVNRKASGGKDYWVHCLEILGVYADGEILRFKPPDQIPPPLA